jgi:hypothetical protein
VERFIDIWPNETMNPLPSAKICTNLRAKEL